VGAWGEGGGAGEVGEGAEVGDVVEGEEEGEVGVRLASFLQERRAARPWLSSRQLLATQQAVSQGPWWLQQSWMGQAARPGGMRTWPSPQAMRGVSSFFQISPQATPLLLRHEQQATTH
jgi:hypothetical protein